MIPKLELTLQNTIAGAGVFTLGILAGRYWSSAAGTTISGKIGDDPSYIYSWSIGHILEHEFFC